MKDKIKTTCLNMNKILDNMINKYWKRWLFAFIFVVILYFILILTRPVFFGTGDVNMMKNYTGYRTGQLNSNHPYGHVFVGRLFVLLYGLAPSIPWFPLGNIVILILCIVCILKSVLTLTKVKNKNSLVTMMLFTFLYITIFVHTLTNMTYTLCATLCSTAAMALLFSSLYEDTNIKKISEFVMSCLLMILASIIRFSVFKADICFWALVLVYYFIILVQNKKIKIMIPLCIAVICMGGVSLFSHSYYMDFRESFEPEGYYEYNKARTEFMDYDIAPYEGNEEFYESIGWNEELYHLTDFYYFIDEAYNSENLTKILEYSQNMNRSELSSSVLSIGKQTVIKEQEGLLITVSMATIAGFFIISFIKNRGHILLLLGTFASLAGCVIFCFYLSFLGRFPLRTYQCVAIPAIVISFCIYLLIDLTQRKKKDSIIFQKVGTVLKWCIFASMILASVLSYRIVYDKQDIASKTISNQISVELCNYALNHKENIYIYDTTVSGDYRLNIPVLDTSPTNLIMWGGTNMYNQAYYDQLETMGKTSLSSDVWFENNVYYVTKDKSSNKRRVYLNDFLMKKYEEIHMTEVERLDNDVVIYKFSL